MVEREGGLPEYREEDIGVSEDIDFGDFGFLENYEGIDTQEKADEIIRGLRTLKENGFDDYLEIIEDPENDIPIEELANLINSVSELQNQIGEEIGGVLEDFRESLDNVGSEIDQTQLISNLGEELSELSDQISSSSESLPDQGSKSGEDSKNLTSLGEGVNNFLQNTFGKLGMGSFDVRNVFGGLKSTFIGGLLFKSASGGEGIGGTDSGTQETVREYSELEIENFDSFDFALSFEDFKQLFSEYKDDSLDNEDFQKILRIMYVIGEQESSSNYDATGPEIEHNSEHHGDAAIGRYQIMPNNWLVWGQEYFGDSQLEYTETNQDKLAFIRIMNYYKIHKNNGHNGDKLVEEIAKDWYGRGISPEGYPSSEGYANNLVDRFNNSKRTV
ncbi:hypothetical protein [Candidatus Absconditicoccus praedator]|uniref:hypothetical protein n=1 Tax=Candidatus Absconditicoccus praedator TaxID=2735562 RepID=UPI001E52F233|nr:hypothetical protein [Candidatus Absconditicoccus praedator]UFX82847.1 hypothetical protein HLG78_01780 [Candidatus Absconditicoccus praedator]